MYTDCKIIKIQWRIFIYKGLIDKISGLPTLLGRAIDEDNKTFIDGEFKDGKLHGFGRIIFNRKEGYGASSDLHGYYNYASYSQNSYNKGERIGYRSCYD